MKRFLPAYVSVLILLFNACQENADMAIPCQGAKMTIKGSDTTVHYFQIMNCNILRQHNDSGGYKIMSLDALNDSIHIYFNLKTDLYPAKELESDDLPYQTYSYPSSSIAKGQVVIQFINGKWLESTPTDTSSITIKSIDFSKHKISGYYYYALSNRTVEGSGLFSSVCFLSSK